MFFIDELPQESRVAEVPESAAFKQDLFQERRNASESAGNPYDPESLLTGAEIAAGLGYYDRRHWPSRELYRLAVSGRLTPDEVAKIAPRVKGNGMVTFTIAE